jgi:hypothetical protein
MWRTIASLTIGVYECVFLFAFSGVAQTTLGFITGTSINSSGAVVPGDAVAVTNKCTGIVRRVTTGPTGVFNAPGLDV